MSQLAQVMWAVSQVSFSLLGSAQGAEIGNDATVLSIQKNPELFKLLYLFGLIMLDFPNKLCIAICVFVPTKLRTEMTYFQGRLPFLDISC